MVLVKKLMSMMMAIWVCLSLSTLLTAEEIDRQPVYVFAAASTIDAVSAIITEYNKTAKVKVIPSFASSSALARQISSGAPADLFLSANSRWMDYLKEQGFVEKKDIAVLVANQLVLVAPKPATDIGLIDKELPLKKMLGDNYLAIGDPDHVPVGIYAAEALAKLGVWEDVRKQTARFPNARSVLAIVERGEVPLAILYATDAMAGKRIDIVGTFPSSSHSAIQYKIAMMRNRSQFTAGFYEFIQSSAARSIFAAHGFRVPDWKSVV